MLYRNIYTQMAQWMNGLINQDLPYELYQQNEYTAIKKTSKGFNKWNDYQVER